MSFLAGIHYSDGRPISRGDAESVVRLLGHGAASASLHEAPGLLMACAVDSNRGFKQITSPGGRRVSVSFDGRLDNRQSLLKPAAVSQAGDAEIAARVYALSGASAFGQLIGDWSLAAYHDSDRELVLASDYAGVRPLYYHQDRFRVIWASCPRALAELLGISDLSEEFAAAMLTSGAVYNLTPFDGIVAVPSGHAFIVRRAHSRLLRLWDLPAGAQLRYPSEGDYEEQFRTLFEQAVASRLTGPAPVGAELSGGLDSSSVVAVASNLIQSGSVDATGLVTFSYEAPGLTDRRFYSEMERSFPLRPVHIGLQGNLFLTCDQPGYAAPAWWEPRNREVGRQLEKHGASTLLTGRIGDLIMANWDDDSEQVADRLLDGSWGRAIGEAYAWSRVLQRPIYPILWQALRRTLARAASPVIEIGESSLTPEFLASAEAFRSETPSWWTKTRPTTRKRFQALAALLESRSLQCPDSFGEIAVSHPFAHRPLVEFMLAVPTEIACRPGEPRRLMRRALSGILPKAISQRRSKASYDGIFIQALRPLAQRLLDRPESMSLVRRGIVDLYSVKKRLHRLVNALECNEPQLRHIILFEYWLRAWENASRGYEPGAVETGGHDLIPMCDASLSVV